MFSDGCLRKPPLLVEESMLERCSGVIPYGMFWSCPKGLNCPAEGFLEGDIPQPQGGKTSMALRFLSVHEGAVMHRNYNLSQRLILAVTSDA